MKNICITKIFILLFNIMKKNKIIHKKQINEKLAKSSQNIKKNNS